MFVNPILYAVSNYLLHSILGLVLPIDNAAQNLLKVGIQANSARLLKLQVLDHFPFHLRDTLHAGIRNYLADLQNRMCTGPPIAADVLHVFYT